MTKKRIGSLFIAFFIIFAYVSFSGIGINTKAATVGTELKNLADIESMTSNGNYYLLHDVEIPDSDYANANGITPLGTFTGTLDGNGFAIKNLKVTGNTDSNAGLFLHLGAGAVIQNLGFDNATITATSNAGATVSAGVISGTVDMGPSGAKINNCYAINSSVKVNSTDVSAKKELLGDYEYNNSCYYNTCASFDTLEDAFPDDNIFWYEESNTPKLTTDITATRPTSGKGTPGDPYIIQNQPELSNITTLINRGIMDKSSGKYFYEEDYKLNISNLTVSTPIGTSQKPFMGTFYGNKHIIVANTSGTDAGVFGATNGANISDVGVQASSVNGSSSAGALIGHAENTEISKCYSTGSVVANSNNTSTAGGLVGYANNIAIKQCYSKATVNSLGYAGGLVGTVESTSSTSKIEYCYATGTATGNAGIVSGIHCYSGGLVGKTDLKTNIANSYTTASWLVGDCNGSITTSYCTGNQTNVLWKTLAQMQVGTFAHDLDSSGTIFGSIDGQTPTLMGIGEGNFAFKTNKLTITAPTNGTLSVYASNGTALTSNDYIATGSYITIQTTPATGYSLSAIKVNNVVISTSTPATYQVTGDSIISADFSAYESYTITVTKNDGGTVTPTDGTVKVKKGSAQIFTIIPNSDCRIDSITYTGSSITNTGNNTYTTGLVTRNETLTVKFVSKADGVTDVKINTGGKVTVTVKSLDNVKEQVDDSGKTIVVPMTSGTAITSSTLSAIKGHDVDLKLDMSNYSWLINGESVTSTDSAINLGVTVNASGIPSDYMKQFDNYTDKTQLDLDYSGALPFRGYLTVKAPGTYSVGKYANLFYFNESTNVFEAIDSVKVADDGTCTFSFRHASKYVIVVADRALSVQDIAVNAFSIDNAIPLEFKTTDIAFASILLLLVMAGGIGISTIIRRTNKEEK